MAPWAAVALPEHCACWGWGHFPQLSLLGLQNRELAVGVQSCVSPAQNNRNEPQRSEEGSRLGKPLKIKQTHWWFMTSLFQS